ncbi:MAG TPA: hypothetical protein VMV05_05075 [bacterium]|nr:hypothetical protein [bacterium]
MSTTVHYFGKIKSLESVREIQDEFREIAQVSGWSHEIVDHVFAQDADLPGARLSLRGVRVTLNKTVSPLQLTFDKDGYLSHIYYEKAPNELNPRGVAARQLLHQIHTSTNIRNSDAQSHVTLVKLLDYVKKRYVPNLEVIDNTGYWYSRDAAVLGPKRLELAKK